MQTKKKKKTFAHSRELATLKHLEKILKACANAHRLHIIQTVMNESRTVSEIADTLRIHIKTASRHLRILAAVDLVDSERHGKDVRYKLSEHHGRLLAPILYILAFARMRGSRSNTGSSRLRK